MKEQTETKEQRYLAIAERVARKQRSDRIREWDLDELIHEAYLGIKEAEERVGKEIDERLAIRAASLKVIRFKLKMRSVLSLPEGSTWREHKAGRIEIGREMVGYKELKKGERTWIEKERKRDLKMVAKKVEEKLGMIERMVMKAILRDAGIIEIVEVIERMGVEKPKTAAYGAAKRIEEAWIEEGVTGLEWHRGQ